MGVADRSEKARAAIEQALAARGPDKTICPSEAARLAGGDDAFGDWMDDVRAAARGMVAEGVLEVTQKGEVVDLAHVRGPIRLRRPPSE